MRFRPILLAIPAVFLPGLAFAEPADQAAREKKILAEVRVPEGF